jgi:hypothetical protein
MPSAAVRVEPDVPSASWYGMVGGRETGDAEGDGLGAADLTLTPDGQFTLGQTFSSMQGVNSVRATGTARSMARRACCIAAARSAPSSSSAAARSLHGVTDLAAAGLDDDQAG